MALGVHPADHLISSIEDIERSIGHGIGILGPIQLFLPSRSISIKTSGVRAGHGVDDAIRIDPPDRMGVFVRDIDISHQIARSGVGLTEFRFRCWQSVCIIPFIAINAALPIESGYPFQRAVSLQDIVQLVAAGPSRDANRNCCGEDCDVAGGAGFEGERFPFHFSGSL